MKLTAAIAALLTSSANALHLSTMTNTSTCSGMKKSGPIANYLVHDGDVIENMVITASPKDGIALHINKKKNVTLKNLVIYHPANG